ncbi:MAG: MFS transporter [Actinomycetota bacterium]
MAEKQSSRLISFLWHNSAVVGITMSTTLIFGFATLYLHDFINVSNFMVGVAASLSHVISVILSPLAGTLSDNTWTPWGRRRPYILAGSILAALCVAAMPHTLNYWVFLLLVSLFFTFSVAYQIPFYALIPEMSGEGRRGAYSTFTGLLRLLGAALVLGFGGWFWAKNPAWLFYLTAFVIVFTAAITFISVREDRGGELPDQDKISIFKNFRRYMRDLVSQKKILLFFAAQFFWWLGLGSLMPFATIMLKELYGVEVSELFRLGPGVIIGAVLLIGAIVAAGALGDRWGHRQIVTVGLVSLTIGSVIAFFFRDLTMFYVAALFVVVGAAPLFNEPFALLAELVPKGREGEFYGLDTISITLSQVPASLLGGAIIDAFGYTSVYLLVTSTSLIAILLMWLKSRV